MAHPTRFGGFFFFVQDLELGGGAGASRSTLPAPSSRTKTRTKIGGPGKVMAVAKRSFVVGFVVVLFAVPLGLRLERQLHGQLEPLRQVVCEGSKTS